MFSMMLVATMVSKCKMVIITSETHISNDVFSIFQRIYLTILNDILVYLFLLFGLYSIIKKNLYVKSRGYSNRVILHKVNVSIHWTKGKNSI